MSKRMLDDESESSHWMMTFADLMTLLLVFFILMFSMSSVEQEHFKKVVGAIQQSLRESIPLAIYSKGDSVIELPIQNPQPVPAAPPVPEPKVQAEPTPTDTSGQEQQDQKKELNEKERQWRNLANQLQDAVISNSLDDTVTLAMPKDGTIAIEVSGEVLFDSGSTHLNYKADKVLNTLIDSFKRYPWFRINIKGHSDNRPISTERYASNWELSALRATTVLRHIISQGIKPRRLTATGYGDSDPVASNATAEGRARNRRIEFVLQRDQ